MSNINLPDVPDRNVLKAPAGGRYDRGWCEPDSQEPKLQKKPARNDRFVRGLNPLISEEIQRKMRDPKFRARQIAQLSAVAKKPAWYEEVASNLMSAERWKAWPGNLLEAPVYLGAAVAAAFGAGCVYDTSGLTPDCDASPCVDAALPDAGDAEVTDDGAVDGATDGTTPLDGSPDTGADADAAVVVDDRPTITLPSLNTLPNNRAFVRWNPPTETEPGKTIVGYQVSWSDGSNNYNKEVTFPFTAIDILSPNTMHAITVRARYDDASYGQSSTQAQVVGDTSLMARYTMDEGAGTMIMDDSGNGNHGTLVNFDPLTAWTQGIIGTGLLFDGVDSHVDTGDAFNFDSNQPFTIEVWNSPLSFGSYNALFSRYGDQGGGVLSGIWFGYNNTNEVICSLNSDFDAGDRMSVQTLQQYDMSNIPHGITVAYNGSELASGLQMFVEGAVGQTVATEDALTGSILNGSVSSRIGASSAATAYFFAGVIDDLAIYNRSLSPDEIVNNNCAREALHSEEVGDSSGMPVNCN